MKYRGEAARRGGEPITLRSLCAADAPETLRFFRKTAGETQNMMYEPDEWTLTDAQQREAIVKAEQNPNALMLGAFIDGRMIGLCSLRPVHPAFRARHRAGLGLCVLKGCWGRGAGQALMEAAICAAKTSTLEQIELSVLSSNESAIRLYKKLGFVQTGLRPRMMKYRDGTYADALEMMLDLRGRE